MVHLPWKPRTDCPPPPVPLAKQKVNLGVATTTPPTPVDGPLSTRSMPTPAGSSGLKGKLITWGKYIEGNPYQVPYLFTQNPWSWKCTIIFYLYMIRSISFCTCTVVGTTGCGNSCANSKLPCRRNHHGTWGFPASLCKWHRRDAATVLAVAASSNWCSYQNIGQNQWSRKWSFGREGCVSHGGENAQK